MLIIHGWWKFFDVNWILQIGTSEQGIRIRCNEEDQNSSKEVSSCNDNDKTGDFENKNIGDGWDQCYKEVLRRRHELLV